MGRYGGSQTFAMNGLVGGNPGDALEVCIPRTDFITTLRSKTGWLA